MATPSSCLVELATPASGWQDLQRLTSRVRAGAEGMSREGAAIRFRIGKTLHAELGTGEKE